MALLCDKAEKEGTSQTERPFAHFAKVRTYLTPPSHTRFRISKPHPYESFATSRVAGCSLRSWHPKTNRESFAPQKLLDQHACPSNTTGLEYREQQFRQRLDDISKEAEAAYQQKLDETSKKARTAHQQRLDQISKEAEDAHRQKLRSMKEVCQKRIEEIEKEAVRKAHAV